MNSLAGGFVIKNPGRSVFHGRNLKLTNAENVAKKHKLKFSLKALFIDLRNNFKNVIVD